MKTFFILTNINGYHEDTYSFGLASIVSVTKKAGHDTRVAVINDKSEYRAVLDDIESFRPSVVGFTSVSSQYNFVKELNYFVKKRLPGAITVCGGTHPTINPSCILESASMDGIFIGESEYSFVEFLDKIKRGRSYNDTDNFAYRLGDNVVCNRLKPLMKTLDGIPFPDKLTYPFGDTIKATGYAPFLFSKGCPYLCTYCSNHSMARAYGLPANYPRYRSPGSSIAEIEDALSNFSFRRILIVDDIFGLDKAWRDEFCEKYRKRIGLKFQCLLRANLIDEDFVRLLKYSGCYRISIGIESGNAWVRNEVMKRNISNETIINAFDCAHKYGIQTNAINIIGTPGETEEMIWDTIRLNRRVNPASSGINIFYPYKGTILGDSCFKKGMVDEKAYISFSNERRQSVLNYTSETKKMLAYYHENWEQLIWPFDIRRRFIKLIRNTPFGKSIRSLKRVVRRHIDIILKKPKGMPA